MLDEALAAGGWFGETHEQAVDAAADAEDPHGRRQAVGTLVAEETRLGMLVGVAVGFELARTLEHFEPRRKGSDMELRFLGHAAFALTDGGTTVLIDPFLTGNPRAAASADELDATTILVSHGHGDHVGDSGARSPSAPARRSSRSSSWRTRSAARASTCATRTSAAPRRSTGAP